MAILDSYKTELEFAQNFFLDDLSDLRLTSGIIYGSSTYEQGFIEGVSDIDICVYSELMNTLPANEIVKTICNSSKDFLDKMPYAIDDNIGRRIEFYVRTPKVVLDITLFSPGIPNISKIEINACRDGIDMLISALYIHGVSLFGEVPHKEFVSENLIPFYSDGIRRKRLSQLCNRLATYSKRLEVLIHLRSRDIIDTIYSYRHYFLKWLFIYNRMYPLSLYKHLEYQMNTVLILREAEINTLMLTADGDMYDMASSLLELSSNYLEHYQDEVLEGA